MSKDKLIFIHIPKNAGTSISFMLYQYDLRHIEASKIPCIEKYESFAIVRNPWDRLVSSYYFLRKGGVNENDRLDYLKYLSEYVDFKDFVKKGLKFSEKRKFLFEQQHLRPQYTWVSDGDGNVIVSKIIKFENLFNDLRAFLSSGRETKYYLFSLANSNVSNIFNNVCNKLFLPFRFISQANRTVHRNYKELYDKEMIQIVKEAYELDVNLFEYDF